MALKMFSGRVIVFLALALIMASISSSVTINAFNQSPNNNSNVRNWRYLILESESQSVGAILYFLTDTLSIPAVSLSSIYAKPSSPVSLGILGNYVGEFEYNMSLPNGYKVNRVVYQITIYSYVGINEVKINSINEKYFGGKNPLLMLQIDIAYPINPKEIKAPLILYPDYTVVFYKYINNTYFAIEMHFYNARLYFGPGIIYKTNITMKFLVNTKTMHTSYWNGRKWIDLGVFPLATPGMDQYSMMLQIYKKYLDIINQLLSNKTLLNQTIEEYKAGASVKNKYLEPQRIQWVYNVTYLGKSIEINDLRGTAVGPIYKILLPSYRSTHYSPEYILFNKSRNEITSAIIKYLKTGSKTTLKQIITSYNAFIKQTSEGPGGYNTGTLIWVYKDTPLLIGSPNVQLILPAAAVHDLAWLPENIRYVHLDLSCPVTMNDVNITYSNKLPELPKALNHDEEYFAIVIDHRLVDRWMILKDKTMNTINIRTSNKIIIRNLEATMYEQYIKALDRITKGEKPEKAFQDLKSNLMQTLLEAAEQLGGEKGKQIMESLLEPQLAKTTPTSTTITRTTTNTSKEQTQLTTSENKESNHLLSELILIIPIIAGTAIIPIHYIRKR